MLSKLGLRSCFSLLNQMYTGQDPILTITHTFPIFLFYYPLLHCCNSTENLSQSPMQAFFDRTCLMFQVNN